MTKDRLTRLKDALNLLRLQGVIKTQTDFAALLVLAYFGLKGSHLVRVNKKGGAICARPFCRFFSANIAKFYCMPYRAASSGIMVSKAIPRCMPAPFIFAQSAAFCGVMRSDNPTRAVSPSRRGRPAPLRAPPLVFLLSLLISLKCHSLKSKIIAIIISSGVNLIQFYGCVAVADAPRDAEGFRFAGAVCVVRLIAGVALCAPCDNLIMIIRFHFALCLITKANI